jgi:hypothetical protein
LSNYKLSSMYLSISNETNSISSYPSLVG